MSARVYAAAVLLVVTGAFLAVAIFAASSGTAYVAIAASAFTAAFLYLAERA
jgi:hypothetical protein